MREQIQGPLRENDFETKVDEVLQGMGIIHLHLIPFDLPEDIILLLNSTYLPQTPNKEDIITWKYHTRGILTTSSVYKFLRDHKEPEQLGYKPFTWI